MANFDVGNGERGQKWRENEEMVKEGGNVESQSLSISSLFPHYLSISSQPGCKAATIRAALQLSILKVDFFVTRSS